MTAPARLRAIVGVLLTGVAVVALAGCASEGDDRLTVYAAASLTEPFPQIDATPRFSFAGSDTLALQIRQGAPADVVASAAPRYTQELYREGFVEKPRLLALNRLTVIVPRANPAHLDSVDDLAGDGVRLVIAAPGVPVGGYTRTTLHALGLSGALHNVVSEEADVKDVVGKVALGQADAGVVYTTDARAAAARVRAIAIPASAQPEIRYEIAVVRSSAHPAAARAFVERATGAEGRRILARAGFAQPARAAPGPAPS